MEHNITNQVIAFIRAALSDDYGISEDALDALHDLRYAAETGLSDEINKLLDACTATEGRIYIRKDE